MDDDRDGCSPFFGLFQVLSIFDWVTPTKAIGEDVVHSVKSGTPFNAQTFYVPTKDAVSGGWNTNAICKLLKQNGIKYWGVVDTFGETTYCVEPKDAAKVEKLFGHFNVPVKNTSSGSLGGSPSGGGCGGGTFVFFLFLIGGAVLYLLQSSN